MHHTSDSIPQMHDVEIHQQADVFSAQLEISNELRQMNRSNCVHCFYFDNDGVLYENVNSESKINPLAVVVHRQGKLGSSSKAALPQFMHQASLIDALQ